MVGTRTLLACAVVLVMAGAWVGCSHSAGSDADRSAERLPEFRAEAWFLPDEELLGFIEIPDGSFTMGSGEADATEQQHAVDLPRYFIGRYEVTVAQFSVGRTSTRLTVRTMRRLAGSFGW